MVEACIVIERNRELPPPVELPDLVAQVREALRRAVLTLAAVPDPDRKYLTIVTPQVLVVRDAADAYGWTPEVARFRPTPRDVQIYLDVLTWLTWYERTRDREVVRLFLAWTMGAPWWRLSRQFNASERTLRRWIDNMACVITYEFEAKVKKLFVDESPECRSKPDSSMYSESLDSTDLDEPQKSPTAWSPGGEQPSFDTSIPAVAEARAELIDRLKRQNRKRKKARKRAAQQQQRPQQR